MDDSKKTIIQRISEIQHDARQTLVAINLAKTSPDGIMFLRDSFLSLTTILDDLCKQAQDGNLSINDSTGIVIIVELVQEILLILGDKLDEKEILILYRVCDTFLRSDIDHNSTLFHVVLRCISSTIELLPLQRKKELISSTGKPVTIIDMENADNRTISSVATEFERMDDFVPHFIHELLLAQGTCFEVEADRKHKGFSMIDQLSIEIEQMDNFVVDSETTTQDLSTYVWLDEDSANIVSIRIGSSTSVCRNWVEMIIRSTTGRWRRMIRLPVFPSLLDPLLPSTLWSPTISDQNTKSREANTFVLPKVLSLQHDTQSIQEELQGLISRFDTLLTSGSESSTSANDAPKSVINGNSIISRFDTMMAENQDSSSKSNSRSEIDWNFDPVTKKINIPRENIFCTSEGDSKRIDLILSFIEDTKLLNQCSPYSTWLPLRAGEKTNRSLAVFDRTMPYCTHKIGLLYDGPHKYSVDDESDTDSIYLAVDHASPAFYKFAGELGRMLKASSLRFFSAGLDVSSFESDGRFARVWVDNAATDRALQVARTLVIFHDPTLMPSGITNRKRHVGNDNVLIIFHDRDSENSTNLIGNSIVSGQFAFVGIHVDASLEGELWNVSIHIRKNISSNLYESLQRFAGTTTMHMDVVPDYTRRIAIQADLTCRALVENLAPPSNPYERYRMLKQMKRFVL